MSLSKHYNYKTDMVTLHIIEYDNYPRVHEDFSIVYILIFSYMITIRFNPSHMHQSTFTLKQVIRVQKLVGPHSNHMGVFVRFRRTFAEVIAFGGASAHEL